MSTQLVQSDQGQRARRCLKRSVSFFEEQPTKTRKRWRSLRQRSPPPVELQGQRIFEADIPLSRPYVFQILSAIYWDINFVCLLRKATKMSPEENSIDPCMVNVYQKEHSKAAEMVEEAARQMNAKNLLAQIGDVSFERAEEPCLSADQKRQRELRRLEWFVFRHGWRMLAILAHAKAFRRACKHSTPQVWRVLSDAIRENRLSIEVFALSRDLDWRAPLQKHQVPGLQKALSTVVELPGDHPHHIVRTLDGGLRCPTFDGKLQVHVDGYIFDPRKWPPGTPDPTIRTPEDGPCDVCHSNEMCDCTIHSLAGTLVELVEYPLKGVGVRSLARFKKGDVLDLFIGELRPPGYEGDPVYALMHQSKMSAEGGRALICPKRYGNWTRFINHSCNPSTEFCKRTIGRKTVITVEATRNIELFEEITIDYGEAYFTNGRKCYCYESVCRYRNST